MADTTGERAAGNALAGGTIGAALIEVLLEKKVLTLEEARDVLNRALRALAPYMQTSEGFYASHVITG
ncbi:MAG: hypothetical protein ACXV9Q_07205, partial [Chthoniobacterales bacterium]